MKRSFLLLIVATLTLADVTHAATTSSQKTQKKDTVVIGTDKKTGGEAAGDRQRVQDIKDSIARQRQIAADAKREREARQVKR